MNGVNLSLESSCSPLPDIRNSCCQNCLNSSRRFIGGLLLLVVNHLSRISLIIWGSNINTPESPIGATQYKFLFIKSIFLKLNPFVSHQGTFNKFPRYPSPYFSQKKKHQKKGLIATPSGEETFLSSEMVQVIQERNLARNHSLPIIAFHNTFPRPIRNSFGCD
jgi:hypothetical protein